MTKDWPHHELLMNPNPEEALFQPAQSKPAAKRDAWLDAECKGEAALSQRLDGLLATPAEAPRPTTKLLERSGRRALRDRTAGAGHDGSSEQHLGKISRAIQQFHHA